ncbi:MAG: hypothetical protein L3J25_07720 [Flavobacteriaceae bacterium]|nr:hypothetical protein [Flavobacteriaceae bacterium]
MKSLKNLVLLGLTVILFAACQSNASKQYTKTSPEIDVVKALIKITMTVIGKRG